MLLAILNAPVRSSFFPQGKAFMLSSYSSNELGEKKVFKGVFGGLEEKRYVCELRKQ
jgi:hypothetical protein